MAVFRVEKNSGYTVMSNHHLRNRALSLKAKGLLSQMLSLPEDWDYTLQGLARINRESIDAIRQAIRELEQAGYIQRSRERDEKGRLRGADYVIFELPQPVSASVSHKMVFLMRVDEICTFDEYWEDPRFLVKRPRFDGNYQQCYGDNIYHHIGNEWMQENSHHSYVDGINQNNL